MLVNRAPEFDVICLCMFPLFRACVRLLYKPSAISALSYFHLSFLSLKRQMLLLLCFSLSPHTQLPCLDTIVLAGRLRQDLLGSLRESFLRCLGPNEKLQTRERPSISVLCVDGWRTATMDTWQEAGLHCGPSSRQRKESTKHKRRINWSKMTDTTRVMKTFQTKKKYMYTATLHPLTTRCCWNSFLVARPRHTVCPL